ncbi:MAG: bacteriophage holin [Thermodesulfobacteriota bacterium]
MGLNAKGVAFSIAIIWAGSVFLVGLGNLIWPAYGKAFLQVVASIYPGYYGTRSISQVMVATGYALIDGAVTGLVLAWLYNLVARKRNRDG